MNKKFVYQVGNNKKKLKGEKYSEDSILLLCYTL